MHFEYLKVLAATMKSFKTRFNYLLFAIRGLAFLFFLAFLFIFIFLIIPGLIESGNPSKKFIAIPLGLLLVIYFIYRFGKLLSSQRSIASIDNKGTILLKDALTGKRNMLHASDIKGFSMSKYPTKFSDFKEIILYLKNGKKIEMPQFLYWNFKEIKPAFEENGLKFLGHEPYTWKFFDSRHYHFDDEQA